MRRDAVLNLRVPREVKEALQEAADDNARTLSSMATWAMIQWLEANGYMVAPKRPKPKGKR